MFIHQEQQQEIHLLTQTQHLLAQWLDCFLVQILLIQVVQLTLANDHSHTLRQLVSNHYAPQIYQHQRLVQQPQRQPVNTSILCYIQVMAQAIEQLQE